MRPALDVANYFIEYSGYTKTHLQISKLTYIAHGYSLAILDSPLISDEVQAWDHGPVIPNVHAKYKKWKTDVIGKMTHRPAPFAAGDVDLLNSVFYEYGKYCGYYLSQITHEDGDLVTPWRRCYFPGKRAPIPNEVTRDYYKKLISR